MTKTIRLSNGQEIKATVTDFIDNNGVQTASAEDNRGNTYSVAYRDSYGPVWAKDE